MMANQWAELSNPVSEPDSLGDMGRLGGLGSFSVFYNANCSTTILLQAHLTISKRSQRKLDRQPYEWADYIYCNYHRYFA